MSIRLYFTMLLVITGVFHSYSQTIETVAGSSPDITSPENASIDPVAVSADNEGNILFSDGGILWKLDEKNSLMTRVAGTNMLTFPFQGDGDLATESSYLIVFDTEIDDNGNIFLASHTDVKMIDARTGLIYPVAGAATGGFEKDGVIATYSKLTVRGISLDQNGNLYIAEPRRVRKVDMNTRVISTVAGTGEQGFGGKGDGDLAVNARFRTINDVALDDDGNLYIADGDDNRIRRVDTNTGIINTIVGGNGFGFSGDGGPADQAKTNLKYPGGFNILRMVINDDALYFIDQSVFTAIRKVDLKSNIITTVVGGPKDQSNGIPLPAGQGAFNLTFSLDNDLIFTTAESVQKVAPDGNSLITIAGRDFDQVLWQDVDALEAVFDHPRLVSFDSRGNLFISSDQNLILRKNAETNIISLIDRIGDIRNFIIEGDSLMFYTNASNVLAYDLNTGLVKTIAPAGRSLGGIDLDSVGNIYVTDEIDRQIKKIDRKTGEIRVVSVDRSVGEYLALGNDGHLYFENGIQVWKANISTRKTTMLGDFFYDGIQGLIYNKAKDLLYVSSGNRIYEIDPNTFQSTVIAGQTEAGFSGDGGPSSEALLNMPAGIAADEFGNVYFADRLNNRIRRINISVDETPLALNVKGSFWSERGSYRPVQWIQGRVQFSFDIQDNGRGDVNVRFDKVPMYFRKSEITSCQQFGDLFVIQGTGTINNEGGYDFVIRFARDTNKIRIVISESATSEIIYDNEFGTDITEEPQTSVSPYDSFPTPTSNLAAEIGLDYPDLTEIDNVIIVYPNPSNGILNVTIPFIEGQQEVKMELIDITGKVVMQDELGVRTSTEINIGHLKAGVYLLKIDIGGEGKTYQLLKE